MKYYVSSDSHLGHDKIRAYCNRPFNSLEQMNSEIIRRHNERVKPNDFYLCLGDLCFTNSKGAILRGEGDLPKWESYWNQLNGYKTLCAGNHDVKNGCKTPVKIILLEFGGIHFGATHKPEDVIKYSDIPVDYWLVGHVHNSWPKFVGLTIDNKKELKTLTLINCCLDVWNFYPFSLDELVGKLTSKNFKVEKVISATEYLARGRQNQEQK